MANLPVFESHSFDWMKRHGYSVVGRLGLRDFPRRGFKVRSQRTGEVRLFVEDTELMVANEFYDGEGMAFMSPVGDFRIMIWM